MCGTSEQLSICLEIFYLIYERRTSVQKSQTNFLLDIVNFLLILYIYVLPFLKSL